MDTKYWNMIDDVVDATAVLAVDKPVTKVIIGAIDSVIESKANGVSNEDVINVIKASAKSKWNDLKENDIDAISDIIIDGVDTSFKTDRKLKDTGFLGKFWNMLKLFLGVVKPLVTDPTMSRVVGYVETLVAAKDAGISNEALKSTLLSMSKSAWNSLDANKVTRIMELVYKERK